jgi:hypothetical protein
MVKSNFYKVDKESLEVDDEPFLSLTPDFSFSSHREIQSDHDHEIINHYIVVSDPSSNSVFLDDLAFIQLRQQQENVDRQLKKKKKMSKAEEQQLLSAFQSLRDHIADSHSFTENEESIEILHMIQQLDNKLVEKR